jgi:DNA-binding IclR family transcriptional regulator
LTSSSSVKSAERTIDVLVLLAQHDRPLPTMTIARRCGIPKSSTHHLLNVMRERAFVDYDELGHGWRLGERIRQLAAGGATVGEAFDVLDAFGEDMTALDVSELARRTGGQVRRVGRTLEALLDASLVTADGRGSFVPGVRVAALARPLSPVAQLRVAARPALVALRDDTGETANLLVRDGRNAIYLEQIESFHALRHTGWTGRAVPLARSAAGAALTRAAGAQIMADGVEDGVTAVACRVEASELAAAVSVTGPSARMAPSTLPATAAAVEEAARRVDREIERLLRVAAASATAPTGTPRSSSARAAARC